VGGRITYVANNPLAFQGNIISVLSINPNLIDQSGGLLIAIATGYFYLTKKQVPYWKALDAITPLLIALSISLNLANYASGDNFGSATTLPWGIYIWSEIRHPVQLYLFLGDIFTLFIVFLINSIGDYWPGKTFVSVLVFGSAIKLFIFAFQGNSPLLGYGIKQNQVIAWFLLGLSLILYIIKDRESHLEVTSDIIR
jgi:phosphatidylglycerol:prolipoprotein diacylglycerol transferase